MVDGNQSIEVLSYVGVESDDELRATDSDVETSESLQWNVKEYWLGKLYFKFALAHLFVEASSDDESLPELDSKLEAACSQYSHGVNLKYIQDQMPMFLYRDNSDDYEGLMTTIGSILRRGDHATKRMLIQSLRRFGGEQLGEVIPREAVTRSKKTSRTDPLKSISGTMDFGRYVAKLKEHADSLGVEFPTTLEEITIKPPLYEATVHLEKEKFTARAKSKKEARQQAAYKACKGLRIG